MGYVVELAKSSRSKCGTCKEKIEKGELRLGTESVGAFSEDSVSVQWRHLRCVTARVANNIGSVDNIKGFEELSEGDQEAVKQALESPAEKTGSAGKKQKKGAQQEPEGEEGEEEAPKKKKRKPAAKKKAKKQEVVEEEEEED